MTRLATLSLATTLLLAWSDDRRRFEDELSPILGRIGWSINARDERA